MRKIAFDLDGVLYPWQRLQYENLVDFNIKPTMSYEDFWIKDADEKYRNYIPYMVEYLPNYDRIPPYYSVDKFLQKVSISYEIFYISTRPKRSYFTTRKWLERYKLPNSENLFITEDKINIIRTKGIDIFVDDKIKYADGAKRFCESYIVDQPWNWGYEDPTVTRLDGILELSDYLGHKALRNCV